MRNNTILIVDDSTTLVQMIAEVLRFEGYQVEGLYREGPKIDERVRTINPILILLDMHLPGADGRDVCRRLKADPDTRHIPIILMTGAPDADLTPEYTKADAVVIKPFTIPSLIAVVQDVLNRPACA